MVHEYHHSMCLTLCQLKIINRTMVSSGPSSGPEMERQNGRANTISIDRG